MIEARDTQAIIAQCTPQGSGALALLRISGDNAILLADKIIKLSSGKRLATVASHTVHYAEVIDQNSQIVDQVMVMVMHEPRTFTGQHTVEITCHNNQFIIEQIIELALSIGIAHAGPGEFSKRAYLNGKIDLIQAEAINEVIHASSQYALKQSLAQLNGSFSQWLDSIEKRLIHCLAFSDASFEFLDEENITFDDQIKNELESIMTDIQSIKKTFNQQQQIRNGIRIAFIGSVNAGKSSLFNILLNQKRAIVTDIAGTTRDSIEAGVYQNGFYLTLIDTAGLRQTKEIIEQEGIERSYQEAKKADILLIIYDSSRKMNTEEKEIYKKLLKEHKNKAILVANKTDLPKKENFLNEYNPLSVSTIKQENIKNVQEAINKQIDLLFDSIESPFLLNKRQFNILLEVEKKLELIMSLFNSHIAYEILSYHLKESLEALTELSGSSITKQGMDAVFNQFCVGK